MPSDGYIYEGSDGKSFHVRYYVIENGARKQKSHKLCEKNRSTGHATVNSDKVQILCKEFMLKINRQHITSQSLPQDISVKTFWEQHYLPYCEQVLQVTGLARLKPSTVRGYKQVWNQHLNKHFGITTLQNYEPDRGSRLLDSLTGKLNKTSLKHVRALGSSIFERARVMGLVKMNPWKNVPMPKDAVDPENTPHYTPEQAENMVTALVDHVDAQVVLTLACFLGLGPAEIGGLQWGDIDSTSIHIRRNRMQGTVTTTKNKWRAVSVPIIDVVRVPLTLWRAKCEVKADGDWLIADLHNLVGRVIKPTVKKAGLPWHGLYAGRRGAVTMVMEATGNVGVAQRLARHKAADTTPRVYNKGISEKGFQGGMQEFSKSLNK